MKSKTQLNIFYIILYKIVGNPIIILIFVIINQLINQVMSNISTKYLEVAEGTATHIKVKVYYDLGGYNYFTGQSVSRGIKLSVSPVSKGDGFESYTAFSGTSRHLKDMTRYNKKTCENFVVDPIEEQALIDYVCRENNIKLK